MAGVVLENRPAQRAHHAERVAALRMWRPSNIAALVLGIALGVVGGVLLFFAVLLPAVVALGLAIVFIISGLTKVSAFRSKTVLLEAGRRAERAAAERSRSTRIP
jgi:hypothetical protein